MAVRAKKVVSGVGRLEYATSAADVLDVNCPAHAHFLRWLGDKKPTKRQARRFLQEHSQYREGKYE